MRISQLNFPKGLNLELLKKDLSEKKLMDLIIENCEKDREARRIILPSKKCLRKIVFHYYGKKVSEGKMTWNQAMKKLRDGFDSLKDLGLERKVVRRLFFQREKEIAKEGQ